jgi:hypothetical protein
MARRPDVMCERMEAYRFPRGGVEVVRAKGGYTLYSRRTGGPVAHRRTCGAPADLWRACGRPATATVSRYYGGVARRGVRPATSGR